MFYSNEAHKLTLEHGDNTASSLYNNYTTLAPTLVWENKDTLDIGCHWGYLQKLLREKANVKSAYGVDVWPIWEQMGQLNPNGKSNIRLFCGDITKLPELQSMQFDIILSSGAMMTMTIPILEEVTAWMFDHLRPGGSALIRTRTFLSYIGGDVWGSSEKYIPYAHLLFSKDVLQETLGKAPRYMVPYCAATWAMHFFRHGFEVVNMVRGSNPFPEVRNLHRQKLQHYSEQELNTGKVSLWLRKPEAACDIKQFLI